MIHKLDDDAYPHDNGESPQNENLKRYIYLIETADHKCSALFVMQR
jgi:hypothetical protein